MIHYRKLSRLMVLLSASVVATVATPSALATCACMCVDTAPMNVCTGFINAQETTAQCTAELSCRDGEDTAPDAPEPDDDEEHDG